MAGTEVRQANFLLPVDLIDEMKRVVPRREQSKVVAAALRRELKRMQLRRALDESFGAWREEPHPELERGTDQYVRDMRRSTRGRPVAER
ncbi:MAG: hypothetical protein M0T85_00985 [Dehalococcoidales bacterium]|nr:hypothetical protein [Dehalococcoidales bacterium]